MRVVVAHAATDCVRAHRVAAALAALGHDVVADRCLEPGGGHRPHHPAETGSADVVAVLWTPAGIRCPQVREEARAALEAGTLRAVRLRAPVPHPFRSVPAQPVSALADGAEIASALGLDAVRGHCDLVVRAA